VPARVSADITQRAIDMARTLAVKLNYCGLLTVEFFLTGDNELLINEIAPRPHNSGHYTLDACSTNQFEQQVRMLCDLPPGDTRLLSPVVMINLLGELWENGPPKWNRLFEYPNARLHLYGKHTARSGRKMGHCNILANDVAQALYVSKKIAESLSSL
jgi:5-(carboxyamino)imidazole ribonucleotide synthase